MKKRRMKRPRLATILVTTAVLMGLIGAPAFAAGSARPRIATDVHDASHADISNTVVSPGTEVHLSVNIAASRGQPLPTGTVDFHRYPNDTCTGIPAETQSDVGLVAGGAESGSYVATEETFSLRAHYDGDDVYRVADSKCEVVSGIDGGSDVLTIGTAIHDDAHVDITGTTVAVGSMIHVQANLDAGESPQPTGSIEIKFWSGTTTCPGHADSTQKRVILIDGAAESAVYTIPEAGGYSYKVVYRGDVNHPSTVGPCVFVNAA